MLKPNINTPSLTPPLRLLALLLLLVGAWAPAAAQTPTAAEIVKKASSRLASAPGVKVAFTLSASGRNMEGTLVQSGQRFAVLTPAGSTWYNGANMWSYNPRSGETTLSRPDAEELRAANPLLHLSDGQGAYTVKFLKTQPAGRYAVALLPKATRSAIKAVTLIIDKAYDVKEIKVTTANGQSSTLTVRSADLSRRQAASQFEYPKVKYPKVPVIDLR